MKSRFTLILLLQLIVFAYHPVCAQTQQGIISYLTEESDSTINVQLSPSLVNDIVPELQNTVTAQESETTVRDNNAPAPSDKQPKKAVRTKGYRIQIFSDGRNQDTLQARARARAKKILAKYPKYNRQVYSFSKAPNYYTRIGNFPSREEANKALNELRRAFPEFAGEIRVVSSEVIINR